MHEEKDLLAAISHLSRVMRRTPQEGDALSYNAHRILHLVMENDGIRSTELAELAGIRPASLTDALDRLEKHGFVTRQKDAADSRVKRVYITARTRQEIAERIQAKRERNAAMLACLTEEEIATFLAVCKKLCAFLEEDNRRAPGAGRSPTGTE